MKILLPILLLLLSLPSCNDASASKEEWTDSKVTFVRSHPTKNWNIRRIEMHDVVCFYSGDGLSCLKKDKP